MDKQILSVQQISSMLVVLWPMERCKVVIIDAISLELACISIRTTNWQSTQVTLNGQTNIISTANFFYACSFMANGTLQGCDHRSSNREISQYYSIDAGGDQTQWNRHLD